MRSTGDSKAVGISLWPIHFFAKEGKHVSAALIHPLLYGLTVEPERPRDALVDRENAAFMHATHRC